MRPKPKTLVEVFQGEDMKHQTKNRERYAQLVIEVRFVGHGYQLDIYDHSLATTDGQGIVHACECHDFTDSQIPICDRVAQMASVIIGAARKVR